MVCIIVKTRFKYIIKSDYIICYIFYYHINKEETLKAMKLKALTGKTITPSIPKEWKENGPNAEAAQIVINEVAKLTDMDDLFKKISPQILAEAATLQELYRQNNQIISATDATQLAIKKMQEAGLFTKAKEEEAEGFFDKIYD